MPVLRQEWQKEKQMAKNDDPTKTQNQDDPTKTQTQDDFKGTSSVSDGKITVTVLNNFSVTHNGIVYKGGSTFDAEKREAEFLIKNNYVVAGSILPSGGIFIPSIKNPAAGSSLD